MKAQHTPGPWKVDEVGRHFDEEYLRLHNRFKLVGKEMDNIAYIPEIHPEAEANARLIAAVPDLLAALEKIVSAVVAGASITQGHLCFQAALNAIIKAKGDPC